MMKALKVFVLFVICYLFQCALFGIPFSPNIAYRALFTSAVIASIYPVVTSNWWKRRVLKSKEY
jgi:hypothetical protein